MRKYSWIFVVLLGIGAGTAHAQSESSPRPRWEASTSIALIEASPAKLDVPYYDSWYGRGRYAAAIGHHWSKHLKTEYEYSWSGEASRYVQDVVNLGGVPYPYGREEFHQLQQHSLRMVYQFGDNQWVHPYVSAGFVMDVDRQRVKVPITYQPSGRGGVILVHTPSDSGYRSETKGGVTYGGGAKFFLTRNAFFNAGAIGTYTKPARTISLVAGFGIDF
jgi:opacity protein-like surface antigen